MMHRATINSTAQHSTAQHSTAQHSTAQHSTDVNSLFICDAEKFEIEYVSGSSRRILSA